MSCDWHSHFPPPHYISRSRPQLLKLICLTAFHLRNCRQLLNTVTLVLTWRNKNFHSIPSRVADDFFYFVAYHAHKIFLISLYRLFAKDYCVTPWQFFFMDNSGKVWLIRTSTILTHTHNTYAHQNLFCFAVYLQHKKFTQHSMVNFGRFGVQFKV